jgi:hypothetical protein
MNKPVPTSLRHDAPDLDAARPRRRGVRQAGAGRWALAVLVGCVALLVAGPAVAQAATGIEGKVTEAEAPYAGITGAEVCLYSEGYTLLKCEPGITGASGEYKIGGLTEGHYRVGFNATGFASQYWNDASSLFESTLVEVTTGKVTENINAALKESGVGSITGQVTSNGRGVGGIDVCPGGSEGSGGSCVETNGNGEYTISGLGVGTYTVSFSPQYNACEEELGVKVRCTLNANLIGQSVGPVRVKAGRTETVSVALQAGGQISGTVTNASITHPGLAKVEVYVVRVNSKGEYEGGYGHGWTNASGAYTISGLESGSYRVSFGSDICTEVAKGERKEEECVITYVGDYYHEKGSFEKAETVNVTIGANTGGVNESLREAFPTTPANTVAPTLTGTAVVGDVLTCSQGTWAHEPTYLVYQWLRNGVVISGQTGSTYTVQAADPGHSIVCSVTAGNAAGAATAMSNAVAIPVPLAVFASVKVRGAVASVTLRCPGPGACSGVMKIVARGPASHGSRKKTSNVTIGVASFSIAAGKRVTLHVHLTGQGRKLLGKAGRRGLAVKVTGTGVKAQTAKLKSKAKK